MPRTPTYGRAAGPGDAVGSSIYEMYAPQRASTQFGVDFSRTGFEMEKDIEIEKQKQLDAQLAQAERDKVLREQGVRAAEGKAKKMGKVSSAVSGATLGASALGWIPGGAIVGGIGGALLGGLFGEEGGYVPGISPESLLYKQYQAGGGVTGYSGGQPKFLRRGYQNLQLREADLGKLAEQASEMGKTSFGDYLTSAAKGYSAGKSLSSMLDIQGIKNFMGDVKQYGIGDAFKHSVARGSDWGKLFGEKTTKKFQDVMAENVTRQGKIDNPWLGQTDEDFWKDVPMNVDPSSILGSKTQRLAMPTKGVSASDAAMMNKIVAEKAQVRKNIFKDKSRMKKSVVQRAIQQGGPGSPYSGLLGGPEAAGGIKSDPLSWWESGGN